MYLVFLFISLLLYIGGNEAATRVAVLGGGVSGLTAAHELVEKGIAVQVYERQEVFGGKARSYDAAGTGVGGRGDLPGEHGFRIFWNYYLNLFDTLQRIQYNESLSVFDYMHDIQANELLTENGPDIYIDFGPENWQDFKNELHNLSIDAHFLSKEELEFGLKRAEILLTTCDDRMLNEFTGYSFGEFIGAQYRSKNFTKFWLNLLHLGGIDPYQADLGATTNYIKSLNSPWNDNIAIKVLQGPTNEMWISPWVSQMQAGSAEFFLNKEVQSLTCSGNSVTSVNIVDTISGEVSVLKSDYYIFAMPVDRLLVVLGQSDLAGCTALTSLQPLPLLQTTWMAGMQFYLYEDVEVTDGFALYLDSPWSLSSVSFRQWWPEVNWTNMGDGKENGILSAIISNFTTPGILFNKTALECTEQEIQQEAWAQLKAHLNKDSDILNDANLAGFSLDNSLTFANKSIQNGEPMFYASPNSWKISPEASTEFSNMFLCGDYVKAMSRVTPSGMEAANESGRRAVNALISAASLPAKPSQIFAPPRNPDFDALCLEDAARYHLGLPHTGCTAVGCTSNS